MTIDITNKDLIERQFRMRGCGVSVDMIRRAMDWADASLITAITQGEAAVTTATGIRAEHYKGALAALKIEAEIRGLTI